MSKETGEISEDIALNLETNFEAVLTKTASLYTNFQKKVGSVSQSLVTNVNSMYRQVSDNLTAMTNDVQNNTAKSINATRNGMRQVVDESIKASSEVRKNLDKVSGMRNTAGRIASSGDEKKINTFNDKMQQMYLKAEQETYLRLGAAAADSSQVIQKSSDDSLKSIEKLTTGTRKSFYQMRKDLEKNGDIISALRAKDGVAELEKQLKVAEKSLAQQGKRIAAAEKEVQNARLSLNKQTDKTLKLDQEKFLQQTISNLDKTQKAYAASERNVAKLRTAFDVGKKAVASDITNLVSNQKSKIVPNASESIVELNAIKAKFAEMGETYNKLSKTRFLSKASVNEFKNDAMQMQERVKLYKEAIENLKDSIRGLEQLHRKGLAPNSGAEIENYKTRLREMEAGLRNINVSNRKTINETDNLVRKQTKSVLMSSWEMVRNFRWQVAAVFYLAQRAAQVIQRTFFAALDKIQKFRTDSMAIAASITYSMVGDVATNFNKAFEYSKDLMQKMEMEAAKTILTLEDMSMLVKTFVQAGIIPKGDEDLKKISTIGTAIKILTEGMANAGVQMRQELYAIIQGRQRATDQVAMMFKMIGININDVLKKAKKEGKDLIDVLADALKPFNQVNKEMENDYNVQLEALQKIQDKITRLGVDRSYTQFSLFLKDINNLLADTDGNLTGIGVSLAKTYGVFTESLRLTLKEIKNVASSIFELNTVAELSVEVFAVVARATGIMTLGFDHFSTIISMAVQDLMQMFDLVRLGPREFSRLNLGKYYDQVREEIWDSHLDRALDLSNDIDESIKTLRNLKNKKSTSDGTFLDKFGISKPEGSEYLQKIEDTIYQATKDSLSGIKKAQYVYNEEIKDLMEFEETYIKQKAELENALLNKNPNKSERNELTDRLEAVEEKLILANKARKAFGDKLNKEITSSSNKVNKSIINTRAEYDNLLESLEVKPKTPLEDVEKRYDKLRITLVKLTSQNNLSKEQIDTLFKAFDEGLKYSIEEAKERMDNAFESFYDSMTSHKVMNPFEAIDNEFEKIKNNIIRSNDLNEPMKQSLIERIPWLVEERKQLERITMELQKQEALSEAKKSYTDILRLSIRPEDTKQATLIDLETDYQSKVVSIQSKITESVRKWANAFQPMPVSEIIKILAWEEQLKNLEVIFAKNKKDVQEPFWKSLEDMSQGWADSLADTLTEVMWNMDSFEEAFKSFLEAILKDIIRSGIKTAITDNLLNMIPAIGNYLKGGSSGAVGTNSAAITGTAYGAGALDYMGTGTGTGPFIGMASGGVINEPIIGRGLRSGTSYAFGEGGNSEVVLPLNKLKGNSSTPNVVVNVINQSGERMAATQQGKPKFDGEKFVVDVILRKMSTDPGFRSAMGRR